MMYVRLQGGVLPRLVDDSTGQASRIALLIKMCEIYIIRFKDVMRRPLEQEDLSLEQNFDIKLIVYCQLNVNFI
jgi:hypothetical protein